MVKRNVIEYINNKSKYKVNPIEEKLIEETIHSLREENAIISIYINPDIKEIEKCTFNDYTEVKLNVFLHNITTTQREIDIINLVAYFLKS